MREIQNDLRKVSGTVEQHPVIPRNHVSQEALIDTSKHLDALTSVFGGVRDSHGFVTFDPKAVPDLLESAGHLAHLQLSLLKFSTLMGIDLESLVISAYPEVDRDSIQTEVIRQLTRPWDKRNLFPRLSVK